MEFDQAEWLNTRAVEVFEATDGWYWRRSEIKGGLLGEDVCTSRRFDTEQEARSSAIEENYPMPVIPGEIAPLVEEAPEPVVAKKKGKKK